MAMKRPKPEGFLVKLWRFDVLMAARGA